MAVWLITGATGFLGRHVVGPVAASLEGALPAGIELVALGRRCPSGWPARSFVRVDLNDAARLRQAIASIGPDVVLHTAGRTPPASDEELFGANFWSTMHVLSAVRALKKPMRIVVSGSAAELGPVDSGDLPVNEHYQCQPMTAYGRSKWLATLAALAERPPLEVVVARVFNPIGPGMPTSQAFGRFADRLNDPDTDPLDLTVGDLDARRDFIDVRDAARAFITLALEGQPGLVYHVGTGTSRRVGDGLEHLIRLSGRAVHVGLDPKLDKPGSPADSCADISRISNHTQWRPTITWEQSLEDLWREARDHRNPRHAGESAAA